MKKTIFALLAFAFLSIFATPIYAQDADEPVNTEQSYSIEKQTSKFEAIQIENNTADDVGYRYEAVAIHSHVALIPNLRWCELPKQTYIQPSIQNKSQSVYCKVDKPPLHLKFRVTQHKA